MCTGPSTLLKLGPWGVSTVREPGPQGFEATTGLSVGGMGACCAHCAHALCTLHARCRHPVCNHEGGTTSGTIFLPRNVGQVDTNLGGVFAQRGHSERPAPIIILFIPETPLKTTPLQKRA